MIRKLVALGLIVFGANIINCHPVSKPPAVLEQAATPAQAALAEKGARVAFDVVSIRPAPPTPAGGGRGGPGTANTASQDPPRQLCLIPARAQLDAGRFATTTTTLELIAMAYGKRACSYIVGTPDWIRADRLNVQATIPEGSPAYTMGQLRNGTASKLQTMLQTMLAERFHLVLHRETREMPVFNLVVAKEGKMMPVDNQIPPNPISGSIPPPNPVPSFRTGPTSLQGFADLLTEAEFVDRPVIDKTGLKGTYAISLTFPELVNSTSMRTDMEERIPAKLLEEYGLKLEPAKGPVEFLVIDRVDKPSEN